MNDNMQKALMDQMKTMNDNIAAIKAEFGPEHQQITAPLNPRFVNTPTPGPVAEFATKYFLSVFPS